MSMSKPVDCNGKLCCPEHPGAILVKGDIKFVHQCPICPECGLIITSCDRVEIPWMGGVGWPTISSNIEKGGGDKRPGHVGRPENPLPTSAGTKTIIIGCDDNYPQRSFQGCHYISLRLYCLQPSRGSPNSQRPRVGRPENPFPTSAEGTNLTTISGGDDRGRDPVQFDETGVSKYQNRPMMMMMMTPSEERELMDWYKAISLKAGPGKLEIPQTETAVVVQVAKNYFKMVLHDRKILGGRKWDAITSACLFMACLRTGVPRTFHEICAVSKTPQKEIERCFKTIMATFEPSEKGRDFVLRYCALLGLPHSVRKAATCIAERADEDFDLLPTRSPVSVAAAAIYMASQASEVKRPREEISRVAGLADFRVRASYKLMLPRARELFPEGFQFCTPVDQLPRE